MARRNIKRITQSPQTYNKAEGQYPRVTLRSGVTNPTRNYYKKPLTQQVKPPINFLNTELPKTNKEVCFVVGGGSSLSGFDFGKLNGFDTIAINKAVEFIQNPTYFITTDYTYFLKAALPIDKIKQKTQHTYFVANMEPPYMSFQNNQVVDTRRNFVYEDLYQYTGVIQSSKITGFGSTLDEFSHGSNSGHCGIQLALLLGYKKIYLLGFDLNTEGQTHFHQSYGEIEQRSFKAKAGVYSSILLNSLADYNGSQQIINLSNNSVLTTSPHISTESGITHDISGVKSLGNWQANTRFKAGFMLDMLIKHPNHRLLYIDVDAVVHSIPDLFKNYTCDIAVRWQDFRWRQNECLSGTIYMENNERTKRICELWRDINVNEGNESNRMEQWNLDTVINKMKVEDPNFTYKNLPPEYTMIFDSMRGMYPNITPVIEHFQASRRFKKDVNEN